MNAHDICCHTKIWNMKWLFTVEFLKFVCWKPCLWDFRNQEPGLGSQLPMWRLWISDWLVIWFTVNQLTQGCSLLQGTGGPWFDLMQRNLCVSIIMERQLLWIMRTGGHAILGRRVGSASAWDSDSCLCVSPPSASEAKQVTPSQGSSWKESECRGSLLLKSS